MESHKSDIGLMRQPRHAQDPRHPGLAGPPPPVPPALHAHRLVLDQPGGTLVRLLDRSDDPPRRAQERAGPRSRHPRLDRELERRPAAIRLDQDRRRDPRLTGKIFSTNFRRGILVARVRALARRSPAAPPVTVHGELVFDRAGRPVLLTRKELGVLEELLAADGAVVSTEELLERVWDENADPFTRTVTVTLARLRRKLGEPDLIETVVGSGYRL